MILSILVENCSYLQNTNSYNLSQYDFIEAFNISFMFNSIYVKAISKLAFIEETSNSYRNVALTKSCVVRYSSWLHFPTTSSVNTGQWYLHTIPL